MNFLSLILPKTEQYEATFLFSQQQLELNGPFSVSACMNVMIQNWKMHINKHKKQVFRLNISLGKKKQLHNVQFLGESHGFPSKKCELCNSGLVYPCAVAIPEANVWALKICTVYLIDMFLILVCRYQLFSEHLSSNTEFQGFILLWGCSNKWCVILDVTLVLVKRMEIMKKLNFHYCQILSKRFLLLLHYIHGLWWKWEFAQLDRKCLMCHGISLTLPYFKLLKCLGSGLRVYNEYSSLFAIPLGSTLDFTIYLETITHVPYPPIFPINTL